MQKILDLIAAQLKSAFTEAGYEESYAKVTSIQPS